MVVVLLSAMALRRQITSGVPGRLQAAWEMGIGALTKQVEGSIGPQGARRSSRWPPPCSSSSSSATSSPCWAWAAKYEWLAAPNADINLPLAMALFVIVLVHISSIRARGPVGYVKHYLMQPFPLFLMPFNLFINLVEEIAKPITLALRLFGNLLVGDA